MRDPEAMAVGSAAVSFIFGFIFFIIGILITRWVFKINQMLKIQQQQLAILIKIARLQGAGADEINEIMKKHQ